CHKSDLRLALCPLGTTVVLHRSTINTPAHQQFSFYISSTHLNVHSFPTRRSSDLLEVALEPAIKTVVAKLIPQHVEHPAAFRVGVAVEFARIIKVVTHDGLVEQIGLREPSA